MEPLEGLRRKLAAHIALSVILGLLIFLWWYGLYAILLTFRLFMNPPYVLLVFSLLFIVFSVLIQHRNVEFPYYLMGGALLSLLVTFVIVCAVNGVVWILSKGLPNADFLITAISISMLAGFVSIKFVEGRME